MLAIGRSLPALARRAARVPAVSAVRPFRTTATALADEKSGAAGLSLTFTLPSACIYESAPVEMVILPGVDGFFGVMPSYVPTVAELKPGVVAIQETSGGPLTKYFISGGFASVNKDSVLNVSTLEAAAVEDLDTDAVKTGLAQYQAAYASATDDVTKAEAEIGLEVYQAMSYAISEA